MLLAKNKLSTIEVLISKNLVKSYISHYEFVQTINVLKEYHDMEKQQTILRLKIQTTNMDDMT